MHNVQVGYEFGMQIKILYGTGKNVKHSCEIVCVLANGLGYCAYM